MAELWRDLDERLERARRQVGDEPKELVSREVRTYRDTLSMWLDEGSLLDAAQPSTLDVLVVGFPVGGRQALTTHIRGLGLRADDAPDNRTAFAKMQVAHARAVVYDVRNPGPGSFLGLASSRQPHVKWIAVGDPNDREVFQRLQSGGASAFIPLATVDTWSERIRPFDQCLLATLQRQQAICPNFARGRPCVGQCALWEPPVAAPVGSP
jgi:hypothetical protein